MAGKYDKNFTENGYLLKYNKLPLHAELKNQVYQFRIELLGIEPTIWRRIQVPSDYNFWDLHVAINDAMGWLDYHLHHFEIKGKGKRDEVHIGIPDFHQITDGMPEVCPGWEIWMGAYFNDLGIEAKYLYDYGDGWEHSVKLEGYMYREKGVKYPICTAGERACPPEDCGGTGGYYHVLEVLGNPSDPEHEEMTIWAGEDYDPDHFRPEKVNFYHPYKRWKGAFLDR
jgi:hypothetical protein